MVKIFDGIIKYSVWVILSLMMVLYFAFQVLEFQGDIISTLTDLSSVLNLILVVMLNVLMVPAAFDYATKKGVESDEFELSDKLNNIYIKKFNNNKDLFRAYVKELNKKEKETVEENFLIERGDVEYEDLTRKEKRKFKRLNPVQHNIYGFNLPLIYEENKGNVLKYDASVKMNKGKRWGQFKKVFSGTLYGAMTVNVVVQVQNFGSALLSVTIITGGLFITFLMTFLPQYFKLSDTIPKKVIQKKTLYDGFDENKQ